jgi:dCMP deaminase
MTWDNKYMRMAVEIATWSKDPSSKIGAIAVSTKGQVLSTGYNGFPRGIMDSSPRLTNRELKYKYIVHAEANCVYNACYSGVSLEGATMYVSGLPCCSKCALALIQVGIKRVIYAGDRDNPRWKDDCDFAHELFKEAGIEYAPHKLTRYGETI